MNHVGRTFAILSLVAAALASVHCTGGTGTTSSDGGLDDGGVCTITTGVPDQHRPSPASCGASPGAAGSDGGLSDGCVSDSDCATGNACGCASQFGGNAIHTNECVPSNCRVDSDCGAGGYCSPSYGERCSGLSGYFCHTPSDCCRKDADCPGSRCAYDPAAGRWQCAAKIVCNG